MNLKTWALQVVVLAVAFTLFFGVVGKRGLYLVVFVAVLSLFVPSMIWISRRFVRRPR